LAASAAPVVDLRGLPEARLQAEAGRVQAEEGSRPFDLGRGPLLRTSLLHTGDDSWLVLFTMHHIVSDAWSLGILVREVSILYRSLLQGGEPDLAPLPVQYADFAVWQRRWLRGETLAAEIAHWRRKLAGAPPLLDLPLDRPRPATRRSRGAVRRLAPGEDLSRALQTLSRQRGTTIFMTLLAGFQALLSRLSGQEILAVGTPIAGRNRFETEGLIGFFVNTLVLRARVAGDLSFAGLLDQVREETLEAYAHQELPFEKLVEELSPNRSLAFSPLFQAMFVLQNAPLQPLQLPGLTLIPVVPAMGTALFDLTFTLAETAGGLEGGVTYDVDLFDAATIERWAGHYQRLLANAIGNPDGSLAGMPLLSAAERHQLVGEWSMGARGKEGTIGALFAEQVDRSPDAVAVVFGEERLSYGELDARSNRLARHLASLGVGPEILVGLCVERSLDLVVGLLGIVKAGGAYVPLDPHDPAERLRLLLADTLVPVVVGQERWLAELPVTGLAQLVAFDGPDQTDQTDPHVKVSPENLAYVMYTSGSTGRPKGVAAVHRGVVRLVKEAGYAR
ncbi:MAG TPA: condensation domain-containing protein, partial [Thermoanaerobaculia bacterium]